MIVESITNPNTKPISILILRDRDLFLLRLPHSIKRFSLHSVELEASTPPLELAFEIQFFINIGERYDVVRSQFVIQILKTIVFELISYLLVYQRLGFFSVASSNVVTFLIDIVVSDSGIVEVIDHYLCLLVYSLQSDGVLRVDVSEISPSDAHSCAPDNIGSLRPK